MNVGVPRELSQGECRVALAPAAVLQLKKAGLEVTVEAGAGAAAGFLDAAYESAGARICQSREALFADASIILQVRGLGTDAGGWQRDLKLAKAGQTMIAIMDALSAPEPAVEAAKQGLTAFALDLVPRITRAQSMDVLSSQANLAGYKAVILAANALPKIFPMLMTAAGTITPAKVLVVGAGVAGLQAIATARRLGGVVSAYDVRPAAKEQVESLGARFVQLPLSVEEAPDAGGYAKAMGEEFYRRQAEMMAAVVSESDVVITTAAVPGQKAPVLVSRDMVEKMQPGSVIVDIAAERGGNCEVTRPGETTVHSGVTVIGPLNLPSTVAHHASQLFAKNISAFLLNIVKAGELQMNMEDEIVRETLLTSGGKVVHPRVRELLGIA